ncbi:putative leader peptide [Streptomyces lutosisoli]|uniref:Leader peptide n=2 Tax=Streptomyces lutosisoli TaxID=2665721 RepID=A0ABW2VVG3_9ACTN
MSKIPARSRNRRRSRAVERDDDTMPARPRARRAGRAGVTEVPGVSRLPAKVLAPRRRVHLYSRPHIDLQRVAGALCRP